MDVCEEADSVHHFFRASSEVRLSAAPAYSTLLNSRKRTPFPDASRRVGPTPSLTGYDFTESARRCDKLGLKSSLPTLSAWPSIATVRSSYLLRNAASLLKLAVAPPLSRPSCCEQHIAQRYDQAAVCGLGIQLCDLSLQIVGVLPRCFRVHACERRPGCVRCLRWCARSRPRRVRCPRQYVRCQPPFAKYRRRCVRTLPGRTLRLQYARRWRRSMSGFACAGVESGGISLLTLVHQQSA